MSAAAAFWGEPYPNAAAMSLIFKYGVTASTFQYLVRHHSYIDATVAISWNATAISEGSLAAVRNGKNGDISPCHRCSNAKRPEPPHRKPESLVIFFRKRKLVL